MTAKRNDSYWHNESLQALAVMVGLLLVIPSIIRWSDGGWAGVDWVVLSAGALLATAWFLGMMAGTVRRRRGQRRALIHDGHLAETSSR